MTEYRSSVKPVGKNRQKSLCILMALTMTCSGCGATVVLPEDGAAATAEQAAENRMTVPELENDTAEAVWPALALLQGTAETAVWLPLTARLEVENIDQNPELPNGCEITSAAIVLQYLGYSVDKVALAEEYLPTCELYWEADPEVEFMGNPANELAFYCLPGAIVTAVNTYLAEQGGDYTAMDISGSMPEELYRWVADGFPVLVWTTRACSEPLYNYTFQMADGSWPYSNSHCVVLTGYDDDTCYLADPMLEMETADRETFEASYLERGQYAVVIVPSAAAAE